MGTFKPSRADIGGSTIVGSDKDTDVHQFSGSVFISGSLTLNGDSVTGGGGGGGTPGGSNTQVQYNNAGSFAGSANFTFDGDGIQVSADADATSSLGRTAVGGAGLADAATVSHVDHNTATNFGFRQRADGQTEINAKSDQSINLKLGSQNKVRLISSGFVGIGENITPTAMLHVSSSTGLPLVRADHPDVDHPEPIFYVTGSGHVGIGTETPLQTLSVSGSAAFSGTFGSTAIETLTSAGALSVTDGVSIIDTTGLANNATYNFTIPNGTFVGQQKIVYGKATAGASGADSNAISIGPSSNIDSGIGNVNGQLLLSGSDGGFGWQAYPRGGATLLWDGTKWITINFENFFWQ